MKGVGYVVNNWQLSGVLTAGSGSPYDATFLYNASGAAINLTGSRAITREDCARGRSRQRLLQRSIQAVQHRRVRGAEVSKPWARVGAQPADADARTTRWTWPSRATFPIGGSRHGAVPRRSVQRVQRRRLQQSFVSQVQLNSPTDQTVRNPQFNADGTLVQSDRLHPQNAGFGAVTAAQAMRTVQVQLRFQF